MLFWCKLFTVLSIFSLLYFNLFINNILPILLLSEFLIILIFYIFCFFSLIFNLNWIFGFILTVVTLGGLEASLILILYNI